MCDKINLYSDVGMDYRTFRLFAGGNTGTAVPDSYYMRALYSQAVHETGNYTSRIWKETKNMFGMRPAQSRHKFYCWTLNTATGNYAGYNEHQDSISDRVDLDRNFRRSTDLQGLNDVREYMEHVKLKGYATDPQYVPLWTATYNRLFPNDDAQYENYGSDTTQEGDTDWDPQPDTEKTFPWKLVIIGAIIGFFGYLKLKKK